jgi:hypothetical protein
LISLGGGMLAREFGYLPHHVRFVDFWPLVVLFMGISGLFHKRGFLAVLFSLAFIALGGVLLAGNLGFIAFPAARLWPGLLVLLGLAFLLRGGHHGRFRRPPFGPDRIRRGWRHRPVGDGESDPNDANSHETIEHYGQRGPHGQQTSTEDRLERQITFSGAQLKIESQAWKGGELGVTAGGVEIDLRNAKLDPAGATLDVRVVMGGVDIRVPDTWQVFCDVTPLFGGADDTTRSTQGMDNSPRLRVVGTVTLGGVTVRN